MRNYPREFRFYDNAALFLYSYEPITDETAKVSGVGKLWNDRVQKDDTIIIKTKDDFYGKLIVKDICFTGHTFDAVVELGEKLEYV